MLQIITIAALAFVVSSVAAVQKPTVSLLAPNAAPASSSFAAEGLVSFEQTASEDGSYRYAYETDAGVKVTEQGVQKIDGEVQTLAVAGSYSYPAPDGTVVQLTYVADENGFQPTGDHLPVPPAVPEAIQRALLYIQTHPASKQ